MILKKTIVFIMCCIAYSHFSKKSLEAPFNLFGKTNINQAKVTTDKTSDKEYSISIKEKYNKWKEIINNKSQIKDVFNFFYENPHWPLFKQTVKQAERQINKDLSVSDEMLLQWFKRYPPITKEGIEVYIDALLHHDKKTAEKYIKQTYVFQNLEPQYAWRFKEKYEQYIDIADDAKRAKRLASQNEIDKIIEMKNNVSDNTVLQYITDVVNSNVIFDNNMLFDASERYRYIEARINKGDDLDVARIMNITDYGEDGFFVYKKYFEKRRYIAYNMLRTGKPELAYGVASKYPKNIEEDNKARIEWLLGFISFRFFKKLPQAQVHFEDAYKYSQKSIRKSKNAFWLAEVHREQQNVTAAMEWYRKASEYFSTFYGYLADVRIKQLSNTYVSINNIPYKENSRNNIQLALAKKFYKRELVQVLVETRNIEDDAKYRKYFYNTLIDEIEDPYEEALLIELAKSNNEIDTLIDKFYDKQHYITNIKYKELDTEKLTPVINVNSNNCFVSTVHSVIRQESNFKRFAKSSAGAIGLMQLMPKTAEAEAKLLGISYKKRKLYNAYNNLQLGSSLLNRLINKYKNNIVYVLYAYNAGEGNLEKFRKSIQNLTDLSILETIELIPIKETRMYIKNVLRNMFYYHQRFECEDQSSIVNDILRHSSDMLQ